MTGWRVGVVTAPTFLTKKMNLLLETTLSCVPGFVQEGALEALLLKEFWKSMVESYTKRRDRLVKGLNTIEGFRALYLTAHFMLFQISKILV